MASSNDSFRIFSLEMLNVVFGKYVALMWQMGDTESKWASLKAVHQNRCEYPTHSVLIHFGIL